MDMPLDKLKKVALEAVVAGETELNKMFKRTDPKDFSYKKHGEIVTKADKASDNAITAKLKTLTPGWAIVSEERKAPKKLSPCYWILDPLDGTTNYTAHLPLWGISLALICENEPILGLISLPTMGERYLAWHGGGAWRLDAKGKHRLHVSKVKNLNEALGLFCYGYLPEEKIRGLKHAPELTHESRATRRLGAAVFESVWVATGRAEYSVLHGINDWDVAAGALLVREAGGNVTTPQGKEWELGDRDILSTCPELTKRLTKIFKHG